MGIETDEKVFSRETNYEYMATTFRNGKNLKAHHLKVTALQLFAASMPAGFNCDCIVSPVTANLQTKRRQKKFDEKATLKESWQQRANTQQSILTFPVAD